MPPPAPENDMSLSPPVSRDGRAADSSALQRSIGWGVAIGLICAALPPLFWWLPEVTVYAVTIAAVASIYIGFAVSDGSHASWSSRSRWQRGSSLWTPRPSVRPEVRCGWT
jgi:hypothetical protein